MRDCSNKYNQKTFKTKTVNTFLSNTVSDNNTLLGAWGCSFNWECKSYCVPVWYNNLNDKNPMQQFHPTLVFSETNEDDSEGAFRKQGIDLSSLSDSIRSIFIGNYTVNLYWIKKQPYN